MAKKRLSQRDVPAYALSQAMRIPRAIADNYASEPTKPLHLAEALNMAPNSSHFRQLCGASIAYGLTDGGYAADEISLTELGRRTVLPLEVGQSEQAQREAFLQPRVINEFMSKYNGSPFPPPDIARNVLLGMGVPASKTDSVFETITHGAADLGLVREIKGRTYGDLDSPVSGNRENANTYSNDQQTDDEINSKPNAFDGLSASAPELREPNEGPPQTANKKLVDNRKVFITHGKDKSFIEPIKKLLAFGEMTPVVSTESQSASIPVPTKVMDDMRSCSGAIIHVGDSEKVLDSETNQRSLINQNVLIEIGAAMALYGKRFILLVREGTELPSNLQGLYEVRYSGIALDGDATIRLLEAINVMKAIAPQRH